MCNASSAKLRVADGPMGGHSRGKKEHSRGKQEERSSDEMMNIHDLVGTLHNESDLKGDNLWY
jgi:hypothetical protein